MQIEQDQTLYADSLAKQTAAKAEVDQIRARIPEQFKTEASLDASILALGSSIEAESTLLKKHRDAHASAIKTHSDLTGKQSVQRERLNELSERFEKRRSDFLESLRDANFKTVDEFKTALRSPAQRTALEDSIRDFETSVVSSSDRLDRANAEVAGQTEPDLKAQQLAHDQITLEFNKVVADRASLGTKHEQLENLITQITALEADAKDKEQKAQVATSLFALASSKGQVSFETFVLSLSFDQVLVAASQRLQLMSGNQYSLERQREASNKMKPHGLAIEVLDSNTGRARPPATLSGGESFLASLSLALGLSEVVCNQGGSRLDSLFIDEGFGSLDPQALDEAYETLLSLRQSGRMIGIISHVTELKERIDVRVEVQRTAQGSKLRLVTP